MTIFVDNKKVSVANETSNRNTLNICLLFNETPFIMAAIMNDNRKSKILFYKHIWYKVHMCLQTKAF